MADGAVRSASAGTAGDRIVFLGHATVLIELDGVRLLTDPLLRARVAHLRRQTPPVAGTLTAGVDAVLISHMHHDHLDLASLRLLGRDVQMLVPTGAGEWLRHRGFERVRELAVGEEAGVGEGRVDGGNVGAADVGGASERANVDAADVGGASVGEKANVGALAVAAVAARHDGRRLGGPRAETVGFLVRGRRTIYFAGDTECFPEMSSLSPSLDVALLPVAGWGPTLGPGHMDPLEAARAARLLRPRLAIPIHWGTFLPIGFVRHRGARLGDPPRRFAEHVARLAPDVEVRILAPGRETTF